MKRTIREALNWAYEAGYEDSWWVSLDGVSQQELASGEVLEDLIAAGKHSSVRVLQASQANKLDNWIEIETFINVRMDKQGTETTVSRSHSNSQQVEDEIDPSEVVFVVLIVLFLLSFILCIWWGWGALYLSAVFVGGMAGFYPDEKKKFTTGVSIATSLVVCPFILAVVFGLNYLFATEETPKAITDSNDLTPVESTTVSSSSYAPQKIELGSAAKSGIIQTMKAYGAQDAAIKIKGNTINLVIQVPYGTSNHRAKTMCDNFLRQVKAVSNDVSPSKSIGEGLFNYHVGAITPDQRWLIQGYKSSSLGHITW